MGSVEEEAAAMRTGQTLMIANFVTLKSTRASARRRRMQRGFLSSATVANRGGVNDSLALTKGPRSVCSRQHHTRGLFGS